MSNKVISTPIWLTPQYLQKMLQKFFQDDSVIIGNFNLTPIGSIGDSYVGSILSIDLNYTRKNQNEKRKIICKSFVETALSREGKKNFDPIAVEMRMMSETLSLLYEELLKKGETEKFGPFVYHTDAENQVILMEDLNAEGFAVADRKLSLDLDHILLVVKALAKMHAAGYLLFKKRPDYSKKFLERYWKKSEFIFPQKVLDGSFDYLLRFLHLWGISEEDKNILRSFQGKIADIMHENYTPRESNFNVLIHGDCWTTNFMFKDKNGVVDSVKIIDYQLCNYNSIGVDLNFLLFTSALDYVKLNHLEDVFKVYYDAFVGVTGEIPGFTIDTVRKEFFEHLKYGFVLAVTARNMMTSETGFDFESYLEDKESPVTLLMYQRKDFISEVIKLLPIFKKYGVFKMQ